MGLMPRGSEKGGGANRGREKKKAFVKKCKIVRRKQRGVKNAGASRRHH